jgi:hypothetical protein
MRNPLATITVAIARDPQTFAGGFRRGTGVADHQPIGKHQLAHAGFQHGPQRYLRLRIRNHRIEHDSRVWLQRCRTRIGGSPVCVRSLNRIQIKQRYAGDCLFHSGTSTSCGARAPSRDDTFALVYIRLPARVHRGVCDAKATARRCRKYALLAWKITESGRIGVLGVIRHSCITHCHWAVKIPLRQKFNVPPFRNECGCATQNNCLPNVMHARPTEQTN